MALGTEQIEPTWHVLVIESKQLDKNLHGDRGKYVGEEGVKKKLISRLRFWTHDKMVIPLCQSKNINAIPSLEGRVQIRSSSWEVVLSLEYMKHFSGNVQKTSSDCDRLGSPLFFLPSPSSKWPTNTSHCGVCVSAKRREHWACFIPNRASFPRNPVNPALLWGT